MFILSFKYRTLENIRATTYFAFTYPYTYVELQKKLSSVDARFRSPSGKLAFLNNFFEMSVNVLWKKIMLNRVSCVQKVAKIVYILHYFFTCANFDECCR